MLRKRLGILLGVAFCTSLILMVWGIRHFETVTRNAYAQWWVADMIVLHLEAHHDQWPRSWDDLRDDFETCAARSGRHWTLEEFQQRVCVDWNADVAKLKVATLQVDRPPFRVVWLSDGTDSSWERNEPNHIIWEYLHSPQLKSDTPSVEDAGPVPRVDRP